MVKRHLIATVSVLIGILLLNSSSFSQIYDDFDFITKNNPLEKKKEKKFFNFTFNKVSETKVAFLGLMSLYKIAISSQDKSVCNFTNSCSSFGNSAIENFGVLHGILMISDRLQRCHGLGRKYYTVDTDTGLAIDFPISNYYLGKSKKKASISK